MALRTIEAPGVEIKEIDKSGYSPSMTGTRCYVMGYANKGTKYEPMQFTSKAAWQNFYGDPDNEAERYFYNACSEVINQNGVLYCSRIPYDNESKNIMVGYEYSIDNTQPSELCSSEFSAVYDQLQKIDNTIDKYVEIKCSNNPISVNIDDVDSYYSKESHVTSNKLLIVDKTCQTYGKIQEDERKGINREFLGIIPVITTALNAMYAQKIIEDTEEKLEVLNLVEQIKGIKPLQGTTNTNTSDLKITDLVKKFYNDDNDITDTVSQDSATYFPTIQTNADGVLDRDNLKKIGVVVYKAYIDPSEGNKIQLIPVESFAGSLYNNAKNPNTQKSEFIDDIINTNSEYIYFFSNTYDNSTKIGYYNDTDLYYIKPGVVGSLGYYSYMTDEKMSVNSIIQGMNKSLKKIEDIHKYDIDIVCDAGLANIASFLKVATDNGDATAPYDFNMLQSESQPSLGTVYKKWSNAMTYNSDSIKTWKSIEQIFDTFCKNTRKDCMFIADGPRPMVLQGEKKIIRETKPSNTIDVNILPNIKWITGLNTNYGAGYLNWFQITDEFTGDLFWCPPSIKAMGTYINTDLNFNYWDAPAGLNRGVIQALDCSFSPTIKQAGPIYQKNWNYAINYPNDGIVLEGQKTFQVKPSAFDRVNVRRLFLRLERQSYKVARYFVYEGNTAYTRQRLIDALNPYFYQAKVGGGIYDYKIVCDESNNDANTIDNNELRVKIGIKPVKTAEFILIDFVALTTGGDFSEM